MRWFPSLTILSVFIGAQAANSGPPPPDAVGGTEEPQVSAAQCPVSNSRWPAQTISVLAVDDSAATTDLMADTTTPPDVSVLPDQEKFLGPAHIPWLGFDRQGLPIPHDVLLIYEGMQIRYHRGTGNYEVRYQVDAPLTEITLRMQFHFLTTSGRTSTITLAPVHFHELGRDNGNLTSRSYRVVQRGNSPELAQVLSNQPFSRTGTARFGAALRK